MVLEAAARDGQGFVLLPAGSVVAEKHIDKLRSWGVLEVDVVGVSLGELRERELASANPEQVEKLTAALRDLFRHTDLASPETDEIFRHCLGRKLRAENASAST